MSDFSDIVREYGNELKEAEMRREAGKHVSAFLDSYRTFRRNVDNLPEGLIEDETDIPVPMRTEVLESLERVRRSVSLESDRLRELAEEVKGIIALGKNFSDKLGISEETLEIAQKLVKAHNAWKGAKQTSEHIRPNSDGKLDLRMLPLFLKVDGPDFSATSRRSGQGGNWNTIRDQMNRAAQKAQTSLYAADLDEITDLLKRSKGEEPFVREIEAADGTKYTITYNAVI